MLFSIVGVNLTVYWSCAAVRDSELWVCLIMTGTRIKGLHRRARVAWNGIYFISSTLSHQSCAYPDPPALRSLGCTISFRRHRRGWNCLDAPRASEREGPGDLPKRYRAGDWNPTWFRWPSSTRTQLDRSLSVRRFHSRVVLSLYPSASTADLWLTFVWHTCTLCNEGAGECETTLLGLWSKTFFCWSRLELGWV